MNRRQLAAALRTPTGFVSAVVMVALVLVAVAGPWIWGGAAARINVDHILEGASSRHVFGTDNLGRDILARVLVAGRSSLLYAMLAVAVAAVVGVPLGALPTVLGPRAARTVGAFIDFSVAFPGLLLAIFLAVVLGVGPQAAVLAVGIAGAPSVARLTLTLSASVAGSDYVAAARLIGIPRRRVLAAHVIPNIAEPLVLNLTLAIGQALLALSGLSFLGLGIQAPAYDWGRLLSDGLGRVYVSPLAALGPAAAVVVAGLAFNGLGEALAQAVGGRAATVPPPASSPVAARSEVEDDAGEAVLVVDRLSVTIPTPAGPIQPVRDVSFTVRPREIVGIVGESGSGKTLTALALAQLVEPPAGVTARTLTFRGQDLTGRPNPAIRRLLGTSLAMVFQDPATSFNPAVTVGTQLAEVAQVHRGLARRAAWERAADRLRAVRIPAARRRLRQYPHELSGGMRQRAMIAMGLMGEPALIVADEPTSALDVTVQHQVLQLVRQVSDGTAAGALLITHDIAVVGEACDRVLVMYAGRIVEDLDVATLAAGPAHPYTRALVASVPEMDTDRERPLATIPGRPPEPIRVPDGCAFAPRCGYATELCTAERPELGVTLGVPSRRIACWHPQVEAVTA